jgi:predicted adenylyl cyclase CyaB
MAQEFEIEVRGPLTEEQYHTLSKKLEAEGEFVTKKDRVLIDYSTFLTGEELEGRKKDIRLRVTNKQPEIIVKLGGWGGNEQREELSVLTHEGSFDTLVKIFNAMGYSKGMLCVRNSNVYNYKGVEFALVEIPDHCYTYEAEKVVSSDADKDTATTEVQKVCEELGLQQYSDQEFYDFVKKLNEEANEVFEFMNYTEGYFKERFDL